MKPNRVTKSEYAKLRGCAPSAVTRAIKEGYTPLAFAGLFSLVSNLLYLALPIYTFQIYGRVMTSYSVPTLLVITFGVLLAFVISGVIDDYRARVLVNFGVVMDQRVSGRVFSALFSELPSAPLQVSSEGLTWAPVAEGEVSTTDEECPGARRYPFVTGFTPEQHRGCLAERLFDFFGGKDDAAGTPAR